MPPVSATATVGQLHEQVWHALMIRATEPHPIPFSEHQVSIQQALALTAASISLVLGLLTFSWFLRMKAMFRHRLIMLLVMSDMFKALWYFISPIVLYASRGASTDLAFCRASGFLLAVAIEGADYAVLVIAIHAALGIFSNKASFGESGLFKYRHLVYAGWFIIPVLMASLAFINPTTAYVSQGTFCYLPVRPIWYRLALSWIPRYLILIAIAAISVSIYFYVRSKFKNFESSGDDSYTGASAGNPGQNSNTGFSRPLQTDGTQTGSSLPTIFVDNTTPGLSKKTAVDQPATNSIQKDFEGAPAWENYTFGGPTPTPHLAEHELNKEDLHSQLQAARTQSADSHHTSGFSDDATAIIEALRDFEPPHNNPSPLDGTTGRMPFDLALVDSKNQPIATARLRQRHKAIKRHLRYVFVYPIVYFLLWIIPFIQHCRNYDTAYTRNPSFPLSAITTTILSLQCAIDSIIFCTRERPWRQIDSSTSSERHTLLSSLTPPFLRPKASSNRNREQSTASDALSSRPTWKSRSTRGLHTPQLNISLPRLAPGERKADRVAEARQAKNRLDVEAAAAKEGSEARRMARKKSEARRMGQGRSWWEVEGRRRKDSVLLGTDKDEGGESGKGLGFSFSRKESFGGRRASASTSAARAQMEERGGPLDLVPEDRAQDGAQDGAQDEEAKREMSTVHEEDEEEKQRGSRQTSGAALKQVEDEGNEKVREAGAEHDTTDKATDETPGPKSNE